jgi:hypothetical protein
MRKRLSGLAIADPPRESPTPNSAEHGELVLDRRFERTGRKLNVNQQRKIELEKWQLAGEWEPLFEPVIQSKNTENTLNSELHKLRNDVVHRDCGPLEYAAGAYERNRRRQPNWSARRFSKRLFYILKNLSRYDAVAMLSSKELVNNLCNAIRCGQAPLEEALNSLYYLQDLRTHTMIESLLEYACPRLRDALTSCNYDLRGHDYLQRVLFLLESAPSSPNMLKLKLEVWIDRLTLARDSASKTRRDGELVDLISLFDQHNKQNPFVSLEDGKSLQLLNSLILEDPSLVFTVTAMLSGVVQKGLANEGAKILDNWIYSLVSSPAFQTQSRVLFKPDETEERIYKIPTLWLQLQNAITPRRLDWCLMALPGTPSRESCRLILDSLNRRLLQPTFPQPFKRNVLTKDMIQSIIHCFETDPVINCMRDTSPTTSEFVHLIRAFSVMRYYNRGLISSIIRLVYQSQNINEFVAFMKDLCHTVIEHKLESPHEFLYTLTRFLISTIPDIDNLENRLNQDISKAVLQIYRTYLPVFYNLRGRVSQSPFQLFGRGKLKKDERARSLLSFVLHRLALLEAFSASQTWRTAATLTEVYHRILVSANIQVLRPMALALVHANIVRPLQEQRGLTRSRAVWALKQIGKIENSEDMMKRLDIIMQKWQAQVMKSHKRPRLETWDIHKQKVLQEELVDEGIESDVKIIPHSASEISYLE